MLGLFLVSFIYCIYATYKDSKTAYFLLTSRAWEMLIGGLAFLYPWSLNTKKVTAYDPMLRARANSSIVYLYL